MRFKCLLGLHEYSVDEDGVYDDILIDDKKNKEGTYDYVVCIHCGHIKYLGPLD